jgi:hypothetical protein
MKYNDGQIEQESTFLKTKSKRKPFSLVTYRLSLISQCTLSTKQIISRIKKLTTQKKKKKKTNLYLHSLYQEDSAILNLSKEISL